MNQTPTGLIDSDLASGSSTIGDISDSLSDDDLIDHLETIQDQLNPQDVQGHQKINEIIQFYHTHGNRDRMGLYKYIMFFEGKKEYSGIFSILINWYYRHYPSSGSD